MKSLNTNPLKSREDTIRAFLQLGNANLLPPEEIRLAILYYMARLIPMDLVSVAQDRQSAYLKSGQYKLEVRL